MQYKKSKYKIKRQNMGNKKINGKNYQDKKNGKKKLAKFEI